MKDKGYISQEKHFGMKLSQQLFELLSDAGILYVCNRSHHLVGVRFIMYSIFFVILFI